METNVRHDWVQSERRSGWEGRWHCSKCGAQASRRRPSASDKVDVSGYAASVVEYEDAFRFKMTCDEYQVYQVMST